MATTLSTASRSFLFSCTLKNKNKNKKNNNKSNPCGLMSHPLLTEDSFGQRSSLSVSLYSKSKPRESLKFTAVRNQRKSVCTKLSFGENADQSFSFVTKARLSKPLKFSAKDEQESETTSSVAVVSNKTERERQEGEASVQEEEMSSKEGGEAEKEIEKQQEMDWKTDEEFKKFMGNPSIEAAIKLEKKRADRKLKELDRESGDNPLVGFFNRLVRDSLTREKERLEKAEETFKALDLNKLKSCFGFDTFFATDVRRFGDGGIFIGNLRKPIEEVIPKLEKKLSEAAGREVVLWFMEEKNDDITKQACVVQPKSEMDLQFESSKLSTPLGYLSAVVLCVATFGTIALMSGFFLKPDATFDDYVANVVPLFSGFLTILGVSEVCPSNNPSITLPSNVDFLIV
uniref:Putative zinc metallopeptidase EGY3ic isoform X1 n=1 Tax=Rhizophora mucronata TaxID=61149 RepID=A0A2P2K0J5_RHIMU